MRRIALLPAVAVALLCATAPAGAESAGVTFANDGRLYAMAADGSGRQPLTAGPTGPSGPYDGHPAWSPDGQHLVFARSVSLGDDDERSQLLLARPDGSVVRELTELRRGVNDVSPAWSRDGTRIAFARYTSGEERFDSAILTIAPGGGEPATVVRQELGPRFESVGEPAWGAGDRELLYTLSALDASADFRPQLRVVGAAGGASRLLAGDAQAAAVSPDGQRIAFESVRDRNGQDCGSDECSFRAELYMMSADGSAQRRLTHNPGHDGGPSWAPDGTRIAFHSTRTFPEGDGGEVYTIAPDGGCLTWLTNGTPSSGDPSYRAGPGPTAPAGCGAVPRAPLIEADRDELRRRHRFPVRWLGERYGPLLLTDAARHDGGKVVTVSYDDCSLFDPARCPDGIELSFESVCAEASRLTDLAPPFLRVQPYRGALASYYGDREAAALTLLSGSALQRISDESGRGGATQFRRYTTIARALRPYGARTATGRLARPALPRRTIRQLSRTARLADRVGTRSAARALRTSQATVRARTRLQRVLRRLGGARRTTC